MMTQQNFEPFIPASRCLPEITVRVVILSIFLTVILAISNAYLALKIGVLMSASIPAAILSMSILRFFKNANVLENNLVQTAASAGEAVAGGIVYTIPALIIIHYWFGFSYWENFGIALLGGILGVLFSVPLRRFLVTDKHLNFPEGAAIAEVLKTSAQGVQSLSHLLKGGLTGGIIELFQTGFKIIAGQWQTWHLTFGTLWGAGAGFSPALIGAGFMIGWDIAVSIFIGAVISWMIAVPVLSHIFPEVVHQAGSASEAAIALWGSRMRYVAVGAMLTSGIWTLLTLIHPLVQNMKQSFRGLSRGSELRPDLFTSRVHRDIPWVWNSLGILLTGLVLMAFLYFIFPLEILGLTKSQTAQLLVVAGFYIFVIGIIFSGITGYFSGLVGVSASPGSSVIIAGILLISFILMTLFKYWLPESWTEQQLLSAEAIAIIIGSVITGIACIANDNIQDLKVGYLLGATPWRQQVMLLLGVLVAALVIPPIMDILFHVYGIADVLPRAGMDPSQTLPAPPAAVMAALTQAVFNHHLPWTELMIGAVIIIILAGVIQLPLTRRSSGSLSGKEGEEHTARTPLKLSILGIAVGMYLPLSSSIPLFVGGMIAYCVKWRLRRADLPESEEKKCYQKSTLLACGLLAGAALMDVLLSIPFAAAASSDVLSLAGSEWETPAILLGAAVWVSLAVWFIRLVKRG